MNRPPCRAVEVDGTSGTLTMGGTGIDVFLGNVIVGTPLAAAVVTIYEGTSASGRKVATIDATTSRTLNFDCYLHGGLFVTVTGGAAKVTVTAA